MIQEPRVLKAAATCRMMLRGQPRARTSRFIRRRRICCKAGRILIGHHYVTSHAIYRLRSGNSSQVAYISRGQKHFLKQRTVVDADVSYFAASRNSKMLRAGRRSAPSPVDLMSHDACCTTHVGRHRSPSVVLVVGGSASLYHRIYRTKQKSCRDI